MRLAVIVTALVLLLIIAVGGVLVVLARAGERPEDPDQDLKL
jgi:hypothetical protein